MLVALFAILPATHSEARVLERDYRHLPDDDEVLRAIVHMRDPAPILNHTDPTSLLSRILIPRVPDSKNSATVRAALLDPFRKLAAKAKKSGGSGSAKRLGWHVEELAFVAKTPQGEKRMTNLVVTKNPAAPRKLLLAAHYDSKFTPTGFVGATDSAAPCAILVDVALALDDALERAEAALEARHAKRMEEPDALALDGKEPRAVKRERSEDLSLQLVFFDGEEAYGMWSHTDSIYGSKNLAANWSTSYFDPSAFAHLERRRFQPPGAVAERHIDTIEHLVLLDLLGARSPQIPSFFGPTSWLHAELRGAESRLKRAGAFFPAGREEAARKEPSWFSSEAMFGMIEDDHLPFLANGVPVLHLIPNPFPNVWHRMEDDARALDYDTNHAWSMLMRLVVAEYLGLDVSGGAGGSQEKHARGVGADLDGEEPPPQRPHGVQGEAALRARTSEKDELVGDATDARGGFRRVGLPCEPALTNKPRRLAT